MQRIAFWALVLVLCVPGAPIRRALAQSKSALSWVREPGAESCIGTVELGQRVERLVGPMLVPAPEGQVSVEGRIAREGSGFVAQITVADASGKVLGNRQLNSEDADCRALDDRLAFVIAVAIDPNAALAELPGELSQVEDPGGALLAELRAEAPAPVAPATAQSRTPVRPPATPKPKPTRPPEPPVELRIALEPAFGLGNLPATAAGLRLGAGLARGDFAFWLHGSAWLPQEQVARGDAKVRIRSFGVARAASAQLLHAAPWSLLACAGVGADVLAAEPVGFDGESPSPWVFGPDLELRAGVAAGANVWLGLSAAAQNRWPQQQIGYEIEGMDEPQSVYRSPIASARFAAVLELRF